MVAGSIYFLMYFAERPVDSKNIFNGNKKVLHVYLKKDK